MTFCTETSQVAEELKRAVDESMSKESSISADGMSAACTVHVSAPVDGVNENTTAGKLTINSQPSPLYTYCYS